MATLTVYSSSGDGYISNTTTDFSAGGWNTMVSAASGNAVNYIATNASTKSYQGGSDRGVDRTFLTFDTSSIADDATINSAVLHIHVGYKQLDTPADNDAIVLVEHSVTSSTVLTVEDFDAISTTLISAALSISSLTQGAYNTIDLTDLTVISKTGNTKIGIRMYRTGENGGIEIQVAGDRTQVVSISTSEQTGTSQDPKLVITYTDNTTTSTTTSTSTTTTSSSTTTTSSSTTLTNTSSSTSTTTTSTTTTSSSTTSTTSSTTTTSSSTTSTSSSTTMPFSIAVDNV